MKFVKLVELMVAMGYAQKIARSQATSQLKKLAPKFPNFESTEYRKSVEVITIDEAMALLELISSSKSKYKENATNLLNKGLDEALLTNDDKYTSRKKAPRKPRKPDLVEFLQAQGLWEDFNDWYKANRIED